MNYKELADKIKSALQEKEKISAPSTHSYSSTSRLPKQLPSHTPAKKVERKADVVSKDWNPEVKHTSDYSSELGSHPLPGADLIPTRVHRWNIKNYSAIVRKMKSHIKPKEGELTAKVSRITSAEEKQTAHENKKQDELWRDMMKTQEERQFQITRITNFFS